VKVLISAHSGAVWKESLKFTLCEHSHHLGWIIWCRLITWVLVSLVFFFLSTLPYLWLPFFCFYWYTYVCVNPAIKHRSWFVFIFNQNKLPRKNTLVLIYHLSRSSWWCLVSVWIERKDEKPFYLPVYLINCVKGYVRFLNDLCTSFIIHHKTIFEKITNEVNEQTPKLLKKNAEK